MGGAKIEIKLLLSWLEIVTMFDTPYMLLVMKLLGERFEMM